MRCRPADENPVVPIRQALADSPLTGEGYRKVWARRRHRGIRTATERVRRWMRPHHLPAPSKGGDAHGPKAREGTITTETPDEIGATNMTTTVTTAEGLAHAFVVVDPCTCKRVGLHAAKVGNRFDAPEPLRRGVRDYVCHSEVGAARGLTIRNDHASNFLGDDFQRELRFPEMRSSPSFVWDPEGNGCAERLTRTLKARLLRVRSLAACGGGIWGGDDGS